MRYVLKQQDGTLGRVAHGSCRLLESLKNCDITAQTDYRMSLLIIFHLHQDGSRYRFESLASPQVRTLQPLKQFSSLIIMMCIFFPLMQLQTLPEHNLHMAPIPEESKVIYSIFGVQQNSSIGEIIGSQQLCSLERVASGTFLVGMALHNWYVSELSFAVCYQKRLTRGQYYEQQC